MLGNLLNQQPKTYHMTQNKDFYFFIFIKTKNAFKDFTFIINDFWLRENKSCIRETLNLLTDADSITFAMKRRKKT